MPSLRDREAKLAPVLIGALRKKRHRAVRDSWYVDETYGRVQGQWQSLYRAIDRDGNLVDVRLSDTRALVAAEAFFRSAWAVAGVIPERMTTDGHDAYPRAIRNVFGNQVMHRMNRYVNNRIEQAHRGIKQRHRPMGGFKPFPRLRVSVASSTAFVAFSDRSRIATHAAHSPNAGASIGIGLPS